ncbi:MAG: hypothetical protein NTZ38_01475 [Candidatus Taylorbacteria bacterium]|nr:hypothetical protein [Candidatus Taylorbacteria bacterium]
MSTQSQPVPPTVQPIQPVPPVVILDVTAQFDFKDALKYTSFPLEKEESIAYKCREGWQVFKILFEWTPTGFKAVVYMFEPAPAAKQTSAAK